MEVLEGFAILGNSLPPGLQLLESFKAKEQPVLDQDVDELAEEIAPHLKKWQEYFSQLDCGIEFENVSAELTTATDFMSTINKKLRKMMKAVFDDKNVIFEETSSFHDLNDQIGVIKFGEEPEFPSK